MALIKKPITDMRDIMSAGMQTHECATNQIKETYKSSGFTQIEIPCIEHIGNLTSKQGEGNEKLIFKILKGGGKLNLEEAKKENDLVDSGLRYDLTLPLSRHYTNNVANLLSPFKALQMGNVWCVNRPRRGRFRQFVQYGIDTLGDVTSLAEVELALATTAALGRIYPDNSFTVRADDKGILRGMALYRGFPEEPMDQVFITLDKMGKIGHEGVEEELLESGYCLESASRYLDMLKNVTEDSAGVRALGQTLSEVIPTNVSKDLTRIADTVIGVTEADFGLEFNPTLVRGTSYYTGTISEVPIEGFNGSVAGGDRCDKIIGKFTGMETPACGFSIGFERIVTILMDNGFIVSGVPVSKAFLSEKDVDNVRLTTMICEAMEEGKKGVWALIAQMDKNRKLQKEQLGRKGYTEFEGFYKESLKN